MECVHKWEMLCAVHSVKLGKDGYGYRCLDCGKVGFQESNNISRKSNVMERHIELIHTPRDLYQIEFDHTGRPVETLSAHL